MNLLKTVLFAAALIICGLILVVLVVYASVCAERECLSVSISEPTTSNAHAEPITSPGPTV